MENTEPNRPASTSTAQPASDATFLIAWLFDRDAECPLCKYNLRGLTSPRCPECGEALQLGVSLVEPYLKAWIALIAGLLPPAGFGAFFIIIVGMQFRYRNPMRGITFWGGLALLYLILCIPGSVVAVTKRRRFQQLERLTQKLLAVMVWLILVIIIIGFVSQLP